MLKLARKILVACAIVAWGMGVAGAEPGVSDKRILFGQTIGFDSVWGGLYKNYTEGLLAYFNYVNANGGVYGRKLEIKRLEDNYVTEKAVRNVKEFGEQNEVFGLVCIGGTGITLAVMPLLEQYRLPTVGTMTGADGVRKYNPYLFHTRTGYTNEVEKMVEHLTSIGITRIAVVYQDNPFGKGNLEAAKRAAAVRKAEIVGDIPHATKGDDIDKVLPKLAAANAQAMLLFTSPQSVADIIKGYKAKYGATMPQPWVLSVTSPPLIYALLKEDAHGIAVTQVMPHPSSVASRITHEFRANMAKYGNKSNMTYEAVEGYLTGKVVVEALRRAGKNLTREGYAKALESFGDLNFGDLYVKYSPTDHGGPAFVEVTIMGRNGALIR